MCVVFGTPPSGTVVFFFLLMAVKIYPEGCAREMLMNFLQANKSFFNKLFVFSGRASRSEYWYVFLLSILIGIFWGFLDVVLQLIVSFSENREIVMCVSAIIYLSDVLCKFIDCFSLLLISGLCARRLHDLNRSGWWQIVLYFPAFFIQLDLMKIEVNDLFFVFCFIIILRFHIWFLTRGTVGPNKYGLDPLTPELK